MATYQPAIWPVPLPSPTLTGNIIQLEPITLAHIPELTIAGSESAIWNFTTSRGDSPIAMQDYADKLLRDHQQGTAAPFAVRHRTTTQIIGCTRLKDLDRNHRHAVMGLWYSSRAWRTGANLEAKLLLLDYALHQLDCIRIEFHTDTRNLRSRQSLEQLGATLEGILRSHQITRDGGLRDSAIYSILGPEWPAIRDVLTARLNRHSSIKP